MINETNDEAWLVDETLNGERLDKFLATVEPDFSRNRWQEVIKTGAVKVNGEVAKAKQLVYEGDEIHAPLPELEALDDLPENIPLDIIYQDDEVVVINKPVGMVVHPAVGNRTGTLMNALLYHFPNNAHLPRAGIVHRLDKDTSGLLVVAKSASAQQFLQEQLATREMGRIYLALVYRYVSAGGTIDLPIARHPKDRLKMAVREDGQEAITHYRIEERFGETATLLKVQLETGRTHQIRVHLTELKFPLVGDKLYGQPLLNRGNKAEIREALLNFPRQALHAYELHFIHPETEEELSFTAPIPEDLEALLNTLREGT